MAKTHKCACPEIKRASGAVRKPVARRVVTRGSFQGTKDTRRYGQRCTQCHGLR